MDAQPFKVQVPRAVLKPCENASIALTGPMRSPARAGTTVRTRAGLH